MDGRFPEMDRIRRHQVGACLLLRPAEFSLQHGKCLNSFPSGFQIKHRQRHGFDDRKIHGTCPGNVFLLVYWTRPISYVVIFTFLEVGLYLNGNFIGWGFVEEYQTLNLQETPLTLQSTLNLQKGDEIWLQITLISDSVSLLDDGRNC